MERSTLLRNRLGTAAATLAIGASACAGSQTPDPSLPENDNIGGEAALAQHPEHDPMRADEYDPATETDADTRIESADDEMRNTRCSLEECPEDED